MPRRFQKLRSEGLIGWFMSLGLSQCGSKQMFSYDFAQGWLIISCFVSFTKRSSLCSSSRSTASLIRTTWKNKSSSNSSRANSSASPNSFLLDCFKLGKKGRAKQHRLEGFGWQMRQEKCCLWIWLGKRSVLNRHQQPTWDIHSKPNWDKWGNVGSHTRHSSTVTPL